MHYIDLQHSQDQRTFIYNSDSAESSGWQAGFTRTPHWECRKGKRAGMGRCGLKDSYSLEPWLCDSSYELWPPLGALATDILETQIDTPRVYLGAAWFC